MNIVDFLNLLVAAVLLAGVYAAMSVGMTIIYGVLKIVNLAHAGFLMLGAYFVYELYTRLHIDPLLGVLLAFPLFFFIGVALYWLLISRIPRSDQPTLSSLLLLFGLWLVLQNLGYLIWGNADRAILTPRTFSTFEIGPIIFPTIRLVVFGVALASLAGLEFVLHKTWFGRAVRALMQNSDAGRIAGVNVERTAQVAFGIGIAFAGAAGGAEQPGHPWVVIGAVVHHDARILERAGGLRAGLEEVRVLVGVAEDTRHADVRAADLLGDVAVEILGRDDLDRGRQRYGG